MNSPQSSSTSSRAGLDPAGQLMRRDPAGTASRMTAPSAASSSSSNSNSNSNNGNSRPDPSRPMRTSSSLASSTLSVASRAQKQPTQQSQQQEPSAQQQQADNLSPSVLPPLPSTATATPTANSNGSVVSSTNDRRNNRGNVETASQFSTATMSSHGAASTSASTTARNTFHQPHGAGALGPSGSFLSSSGYGSYHQQQQGSYHPHPVASTAYYSNPQQTQNVLSLESPLPAMVQRSLGDRSNEKRKNAALEIEALVKSLQEAKNMNMVQAVIAVLSKDFCTSMNSNYRKGGLVGLAAAAIGLMQNTRNFLHILLPPVLHCFDDPESRVRYYACESLYNIAKVSRQAVLPYFNQIFEGLTKLFVDVDVDVKNGANLLDRLIKDIVTEADTFQVDQFLPLLQNYIRRSNPYIRQLLVGWITLLDSIPDVHMLDYLPDYLDGLFNMLSDSNREIRQAADAALSEFLRELSVSTVVECGPVISILVMQCRSKERLNRLTAITWLAELIHHPFSGGDALLPFHADLLGAILCCISDNEQEIRIVAERTNDNLLTLVKETTGTFTLPPLLETLTQELLSKDDVPTKMAALSWINMLLEKRSRDMNVHVHDLLPVLLRTLSDPSDAVVLLDLQVLSRISLSKNSSTGKPFDSPSAQLKRKGNKNAADKAAHGSKDAEQVQFQMVLNAILNLFAQDRPLLETRGSLIIRKLCVLLNAKSVYIRMADTLASYERTADGRPADLPALQFISTMVQTLNLILLTAAELQDLRTTLASSFQSLYGINNTTAATNFTDLNAKNGNSSLLSAGTWPEEDKGNHNANVFCTIFHCWCHNPVATFSLCLLAQAYDLSFALVRRFSEMPNITVGFLMQMDKLVYLLESPVYTHLRLQLLQVEASHHAALLKSIYGILMCLPQGDAFRLLNDRLTAVCNLRDHLGMPNLPFGSFGGSMTNGSGNVAADFEDFQSTSLTNRRGLDMDQLLHRLDTVVNQHEQAKHQHIVASQDSISLAGQGISTATDAAKANIPSFGPSATNKDDTSLRPYGIVGSPKGGSNSSTASTTVSAATTTALLSASSMSRPRSEVGRSNVHGPSLTTAASSIRASRATNSAISGAGSPGNSFRSSSLVDSTPTTTTITNVAGNVASSASNNNAATAVAPVTSLSTTTRMSLHARAATRNAQQRDRP